MSNPILAAMSNEFCGPMISNGQFQPSVEGYATARGALEQACKEHDAHLARDEDDWREADRVFLNTVSNLGSNASVIEKILGRIFGHAVSYREYIWSLNPRFRLGYLGDKLIEMPMYKKRSNASYTENIMTKPTVYGTGILLQAPVVTQYKNGIKVMGSEFALSGQATNPLSVGAWQLVTLVHLNPSYFENSRLGNYCSLFSKFKFTKLRLSYITQVGTSTSGNILVEYAPSATEVQRNWNASTFLNQVMGNAGSCLMPIWENFKVDIPLEESEFKYIDQDTTPDIKESSNGTVSVYCGNFSSGSTGTGYYILEYECLFDSPITTPNLSSMPHPASWSYQPFLIEQPVLGAAGQLAVRGSFLDNTVYKIIIDVKNSYYQTNDVAGRDNFRTLFAEVLNVVGGPNGATDSSPIIMRDGFTCYMNTRLTPNGVGRGAPLFMTLTGAMVGRALDSVLWTQGALAQIAYIRCWALVIRGPTNQNQADST